MVNAREISSKIRRSVLFHIEKAKLEFAIELKRVMDASGVSNADLAERLDVSRPMVSKLLRGDTNVTLETMVRAAYALEHKYVFKLAPASYTTLNRAVNVDNVRTFARVGHRRSEHGVRDHLWLNAANECARVETNETEPLAA